MRMLAAWKFSPNQSFLLKAPPEIFVSYAWGDDSSEDARKHTEVVDLLCETLSKDRWNIIRDKTTMRPGDLISGFIKRIGLADDVIVVLSDKYLRSPYLRDRVALHLPALARRKRGLPAPHHPVTVGRYSVRHLA